MKEGDTISFKYKGGRKVRGVVHSHTKRDFVLKLLTDYIGKNEEWYAGEYKRFNLNECKKLTIT